MGADRKGPLAAFVVIAIIAAILLVTSVRSQAAPGSWLDPHDLPGAVVAAPPLAPGPDPAVVEAGVVLVHKARPTEQAAADPAPHPVSVRHVVRVAAPRVAGTHVPSRHTRRDSPNVSGNGTAAVVTAQVVHDHGRHRGRDQGATHGHGRHLGWTKHAS